jgi:hypothetical protein
LVFRDLAHLPAGDVLKVAAGLLVAADLLVGDEPQGPVAHPGLRT